MNWVKREDGSLASITEEGVMLEIILEKASAPKGSKALVVYRNGTKIGRMFKGTEEQCKEAKERLEQSIIEGSKLLDLELVPSLPPDDAE